MKTEQEPIVILQNSDQHFSDMRTVFGMCHTKEAGTTVFKCATTCADLPNCPTKIVPKGWYDASLRQVEILQRQNNRIKNILFEESLNVFDKIQELQKLYTDCGYSIEEIKEMINKGGKKQ